MQSIFSRRALLKAGLCSSILIGAVVTALPASAGVGYIQGPHVKKGQTKLESIGIYAFDYDDDDYEFENEFEVYYGVTEQFQIEAEAEIKKENGEDTDFDKVVLFGRYELAEPGELFIDTAVKAGYAYSTSGDADEVELQFLLQKIVDAYKIRSNIEFAHEVGSDSESGVDLQFELGAYRDVNGISVGLEYYGDIGKLNEQSGYSNQGHYIGPIIGSETHLSDSVELEYKIGYYQGISSGADDGAIKYILELKF